MKGILNKGIGGWEVWYVDELSESNTRKRLRIHPDSRQYAEQGRESDFEIVKMFIEPPEDNQSLRGTFEQVAKIPKKKRWKK